MSLEYKPSSKPLDISVKWSRVPTQTKCEEARNLYRHAGMASWRVWHHGAVMPSAVRSGFTMRVAGGTSNPNSKALNRTTLGYFGGKDWQLLQNVPPATRMVHPISRCFGGPASRHESLNSLFQVALHLPS